MQVNTVNNAMKSYGEEEMESTRKEINAQQSEKGLKRSLTIYVCKVQRLNTNLNTHKLYVSA